MKPYFLLTILCFLFENQPVFSQASPFVELSRAAAIALFGVGQKRVLNCSTLVNKSWAYPSAQVVPFCNEAETSCLRYGLMEEKMAKAKGATFERVKKDFFLARDDVMLKLRGCQLALEASVTDPSALPGATSYGPNPMNVQGARKY